MSDSASSLAPTPATGSALEGSALALAILSGALLWLGLFFAYDCSFQSLLMPVGGATLAPFALWMALHAQTDRKLRSPMTRIAVALSVLPTFACAGLILCDASMWLGVPTALLAIGISFLPWRASPRAPLLLGGLSLAALPVAWVSEEPAALLALALGCLLALLGVQLGSVVVARQGRASSNVVYGIVLSVATLVMPLIYGMFKVATED